MIEQINTPIELEQQRKKAFIQSYQNARKEYKENIEKFLGFSIPDNYIEDIRGRGYIEFKVNEKFLDEKEKEIVIEEKDRKITLDYDKVDDFVEERRKNLEELKNRGVIKDFLIEITNDEVRIIIYHKNGEKTIYEYEVQNVSGFRVVDRGQLAQAEKELFDYIKETGDLSKLFDLRELKEYRIENKVEVDRDKFSNGIRYEYYWTGSDKEAFEDVDRWERIKAMELLKNEIEKTIEQIANANNIEELNKVSKERYNKIIMRVLYNAINFDELDYRSERLLKKLKELDKEIPDTKDFELYYKIKLLKGENVNIDLEKINKLRKEILLGGLEVFKSLDNSIKKEKSKQLQKRVKELLNKANSAKSLEDYMHYLTKAEKINNKLILIDPKSAYNKKEFYLIANANLIRKVERFNNEIDLNKKLQIIKEIKEMPQTKINLDLNKVKETEQEIRKILQKEKTKDFTPKTAYDYEKLFEKFASPEMKKRFDIQAENEKNLRLIKYEKIILPEIKQGIDRKKILEQVNLKLEQQRKDLLWGEGTRTDILPPQLKKRQGEPLPELTFLFKLKYYGKELTGGFIEGFIEAHYVPGLVIAGIVKNPAQGTKEALVGTINYFEDLILSPTAREISNFLGWTAASASPFLAITNKLSGTAALLPGTLEARVKRLGKQKLLTEQIGQKKVLTERSFLDYEAKKQMLKEFIEQDKERNTKKLIEEYKKLAEKVKEEIKQGKITDNYVKLAELKAMLEDLGISFKERRQVVVKQEVLPVKAKIQEPVKAGLTKQKELQVKANLVIQQTVEKAKQKETIKPLTIPKQIVKEIEIPKIEQQIQKTKTTQMTIQKQLEQKTPTLKQTELHTQRLQTNYLVRTPIKKKVTDIPSNYNLNLKLNITKKNQLKLPKTSNKHYLRSNKKMKLDFLIKTKPVATVEKFLEKTLGVRI